MQKSTNTVVKKASKSTEGKPKSAENTSSSKNSSSILMPTIVGKSVKGAAMQAVAMSRARASRPNTSRSVMTAKSGRSLSSVSKPPQRVMQKSTWKARNNNKKAVDLIKKQDDDIIKNLPPSLAKEYKLLQLSILKKSISKNATPIVYQQFFLSWFSKGKEREIPLAAIQFILSHANLLKVHTSALIQEALKHPCQYLSYLIKVMQSQDRSTTILAKNYSNRQQDGGTDPINPTIYIMRKIDSFSKTRSMVVVYEISILHHQKLGKICRYRSWSLISCDEANNVFDPIFNNIFLTNLNIKGEAFNYVGTILRRSLKHHSNNEGLDIASILRTCYHMFPSHMQAK